MCIWLTETLLSGLAEDPGIVLLWPQVLLMRSQVIIKSYTKQVTTSSAWRDFWKSFHYNTVCVCVCEWLCLPLMGDQGCEDLLLIANAKRNKQATKKKLQKHDVITS